MERQQTSPDLGGVHARPLAAGPPKAILRTLDRISVGLEDLVRRRSSTPPEGEQVDDEGEQDIAA